MIAEQRKAEIYFSNMLVNAQIALYPVKESRQYHTGFPLSPFELVESLRHASLKEIDRLSISLNGGNTDSIEEGRDHLANMFMGSYTFPNKHAMSTITEVMKSSNRHLPIMTSDATLEGEGPEIGKPTLLTRIGGCAVRCLGCDTPHSWNADNAVSNTELNPHDSVFNRVMDISDISNLIVQQTSMYGLKRVSITGGEPLHYQHALALLVADLWLRGLYVNLETSGTLFDPITFAMVHSSIDIKTPSSKVELSDTQIGALHAVASYEHSNATHVKAVVKTKEDLEFLLDNFGRILNGNGRYRPICITPWAADSPEKLDLNEMSMNVNNITSWIFSNARILDSRQVRIIGQQHKTLGFI